MVDLVAASKKRKLIVETESDKDDDSEDADALGQETKRAKVAHQPENVEEEHEQTSGDMGATCTLQIRAMDGSSITHTFREEGTQTGLLLCATHENYTSHAHWHQIRWAR